MNSDVLGAQPWSSGGPPAGPLTFPAWKPSPILRFPLLAEVNLLLHRYAQELLPGNLGVLVEVMADALGQIVEWRPRLGSGRRNSVIRIGSDHNSFPLVRQLASVKSYTFLVPCSCR